MSLSESCAKASSTQRRLKLALEIREFGFDVMPCSYCRSAGRRCKMLAGKSKCSECVRRGRSCDASANAICELDRLLNESDRLEREEESEELILRQRAEALRRAQAEMDESLAKLDRIRKAKRMVFKKGREIPDGGPEDSVVSSSESAVAKEAQAGGAFGVVDWEAVFEDPELADFDFGTPLAVPESVGGS
ncbi:hypothetical protein CH35J_002023 [Colletotrichum higginsianum]|uniref:Uncharacterized protein n=1 Tax=Colletotrichum higginsianum TaxID=80884 RepID=A0A4T0WFH5_9PEZI|nr:hypothetical protein CH35J_003408 [Colletotrichum higginsianum]TID04838.1 hypothetical protein CH35J_002023 [Colletotrichum higginsianum]